MSAPLFPTSELDLTKMDRQSLLLRMQTLAYQVNPKWSDFSLNFPENILLEAEAQLAEMLNMITNERARQLSNATVTDRLALIRLSKPYGFTLIDAVAAQVSGTFRVVNGALASKVVTLPIGTRIKAGESQYQLLAASSIAIGQNASPTVTMENSEIQSETYLSDETANIILQLGKKNYSEDATGPTITITASNGVYLLVDGSGARYRSFLEMGPSTLGAIFLVDSNGYGYVYFGNGINGTIPKGSIVIEYKTGGGEAGRVSPLTTWVIQDAVYDSDGQPINVTFYNPSLSVGGYDAMTVEEGRILAPLALRTLERCVNEEDYEYAAMTVPGIARAAFMTSNHDSSIPEDYARLYAVAYGTPYTNSKCYPPATPTTAQLAAIAAKYNATTGEFKQAMGVNITSYAAILRPITVKVKIYKKANFIAATVSANILNSLETYFAVADATRQRNSVIDFGYKLLGSDGNPDYQITWSGVFNAIRDTEGVRSISSAYDGLLLGDSGSEIRQDIVLAPNEFPQFLSVTVYDMDNSGVPI